MAGDSHTQQPEESGDDSEHPRGALVFMLVYLLLMAILWTNVYLRLWGG